MNEMKMDRELVKICEKIKFLNVEDVSEHILTSILKSKEMKEKIKDLKNTINIVNNELTELHSCKVHLEEEIEQDINEMLRMDQQEKEEKKEFQDLHSIDLHLQKDIECIHEEAKPLDIDVAIITKNCNTLKAYKDLTGIKWNYRVSSSCEGIAYNPVKDYLNPVSYSMKNGNKVWDEIEKCSHATWAHIIENPTSVQNEIQQTEK